MHRTAIIVERLAYKITEIRSVIGVFIRKMAFYIRLNKKRCENYL